MPLKYSQADPVDPVDGSEIWGVTQAGEDRRITLDNVTEYVNDSSKAVFVILVSDPNGDAITTGDGKAYFPCPEAINGYNLTKVEMGFTTASSSGIPTVQINNTTQAADMLTTKLTVDANELYSSTAATPAVIDAANDDVATGDLLRIDNDVAGTGAKGQVVTLTFEKP